MQVKISAPRLHWTGGRSSSANTCRSGDAVSACQPTAEAVSAEAMSFGAMNFIELRNRCMGNADLMRRVLKKFQRRFSEELAELNEALELGDTPRLARLAHRVKGTSASVSARRLQQTAAELEELGRAGRAAEILPCIERLREEWEKCSQEAETVLSAGETT